MTRERWGTERVIDGENKCENERVRTRAREREIWYSVQIVRAVWFIFS